MSKSDVRGQRLNKEQARKLVAKISNLYPVNIHFSRHALDELKKDNLIISDVLNVIKSPDAKILSEGEWENNSYRYRLETNNIMVVIAFDSSTSFVVVTAWRKKT